MADASRQSTTLNLSEEDRELLRTAEHDGVVSAKLYDSGDFSEEGFLRFGRLEGLCLKGLMRFVDRIGLNDRTPGDVRMVFALTEAACA